MKTTSRTEKKYYAFDSAPRCGARTKGKEITETRAAALLLEVKLVAAFTAEQEDQGLPNATKML